MNAIKFIKLYGLHSARVTVEDAQENTHYCTETGYHSIKLDVAYEPCPDCVSIPDLKRLVESVDIISKFDSVQEAQDAIANAPDGATEFRKLSCSTRYIKVGPRFFEYWDGSNWCRPTVPFTDETHILRFTELSKLKQAIADYENIGGEHV